MLIVKNWEDESEYDYLKTKRVRVREGEATRNREEKNSGRQWAWEFLRRNPEYQAQYFDLLKHPEKTLNNEIAEGHVKSNYYGVELLQPGDVGYVIFPCDEALSSKWELCPLIHPMNKSPLALNFTLQMAPMHLGGEVIPEDRVAISFDLSLPLKPQLDAARHNLEGRLNYLKETEGLEEPKGKKMPDCDLRIRYLRILDAHTKLQANDYQGATLKSCADIIFPEESFREINPEDRFQQGLKAAKKLIYGAYRKFLINTAAKSNQL